MTSRRSIVVTKWMLAFSALAGIVLVYALWLHVNSTTVALTLLLFILVLAAKWGLQYAVVLSIAATVCYNFFFLPPVNTFTISDPQNWLALLAFLATAIIASRLAERARREASDARARQRELEVLFRLSRELLQSESIATMLSSIPATAASLTTSRSGMLYLLDGDRLYQAGRDVVSEVEIPHLRQRSLLLTAATEDAGEMQVPIRTGVRPKGMLVLRGVTLSIETAEAIGSLISISIDRAQALESIAQDKAAKESERLRTLLTDSITHELRTPLTSIKGAATALLSKVSHDEAQELLTIIDEESDRLNKLVSEAVEMAQLDAQQVQMHFGPVSVRELVKSACETCSWVEEAHVLRTDIPPNIQVLADPIVLQKVVCNLLENAAKYSNAGSPITITAETNGETVSINVADQGIGIDPSEQALIFERFYRGRSRSDGTVGTGMGLSISRAIAEAHGGRLGLTSQMGQGSVFTVTIPAFVG
jgi:two-component system sensor histidine kinase KdpD